MPSLLGFFNTFPLLKKKEREYIGKTDTDTLLKLRLELEVADRNYLKLCLFSRPKPCQCAFHTKTTMSMPVQW